MIENAAIIEDFAAIQSEDGMISLTRIKKDLTIHFPALIRTKFLRLTAYQADFGERNNFVLTEFIVTGDKNYKMHDN